MRVEVAEVGERPKVWTRARRQAPAGCKRLGELFAQQEWADKAIVILDWNPGEIEQASTPIVRVNVYKRFGERLLTLDQRYEVNSLFETDQIGTLELGWITEEFRTKLEQELLRGALR